jgi:hypothetical protein
MLAVTIDNREVRSRTREHAFDARRREASSADSLHASNSGIASRKLSHEIGCSVRRVVIDEDKFPGAPYEGLIYTLDELGHVFAFIQGGNDY